MEGATQEGAGDGARAPGVVRVPAAQGVGGDPPPEPFISYSRRDAAFVADLAARLAARGVPVWVDREDIPAASRWRDELMRAIEQAGAFVFVISPDSVASEWCGRELGHAVAAGKRVIPVLRRPAQDVPPELAARQYIAMGPDDDPEAALDQLVEAIRTDVDWVREHTRWLAEARDWERAGEDRGALLRGEELREAEAWLARAGGHEQRPTPLQLRYLQASRRGVTRRLQLTLGAAAVAVAVAAGLAVFALVQRGQAIDRQRVAESRALAAAADAQLPVDPEVSVLLASEAAREEPTAEAERALRRAIASSFVRATIGGPQAFVQSAALTPDGRFLAAAGDPSVTGLHDVATGRRVAAPDPGPARALRVSVSADGTAAATTSEDGRVRVWAIPSGDPIAAVRVPAGLSAATLAPDASRMTTVTAGDAVARLWDVPTGRLVAELRGHAGQVFAARFSPDGARILTAGQDGTARIFDAADGRPLAVLRAGAQVNRSAWSPDGRRAATAAQDGIVTIWDAATGARLHAVAAHDGAAVDVAFAPGGARLVSGGDDATARVIDAGSGEVAATLRGHTGAVDEVSVSQSGDTILTASQDGTARLWDAATAAQVAVLRGHHDGVVAATLGRGGDAAVTVAQDGSAKVWRTPPERGARLATGGAANAVAAAAAGTVVTWAPGDRVALWRPGATAAPTVLEAAGPVTAAAVDGRGDRVFATPLTGGGIVVDARTGRVIATVPVSGGLAVAAATDRDGDRVATYDGAAVSVTDVASGRALASIPFPSGLGGVVALSPDGDLVAAAAVGGPIRVFDVATGAKTAEVPGRTGAFSPAIAFSPDGRLVTATVFASTLDAAAPTTTTSDISIVESRTGRVVSRLPATVGELTTAGFSPDGTRLVVTSRGVDDPVRVIDVASGRAVVELRGGPVEVADAAWSADGARIATMDRRQVVTVWDAATGDALESIRTGEPPFRDGDPARASVDWAPGGTRLVALASTGAVGLLDCRACGSLDDLLARAPSAVSRGRELTEQERATLAPG